MCENLEKVYERINKLFALAKRAGTEAEAQNAALRARELLLKYNLTEADLPTSQKRTTIARNTIDQFSQKWQTAIAVNISSYYRCQIVKNHNKRLIIIGLKEDVEIFTPILSFTFESFINCFKKRIKADETYQSMDTHNKHTHYQLYLDTYTIGYISALRQKLEEQNIELSQCRDLVLTTPQEVSDYVSSISRPSKCRSIMRKAVNSDYERHGYIDGMSNSDRLHKNLTFDGTSMAA